MSDLYPNRIKMNVPFELVVNEAIKITGRINQRQNYGQWNTLGFAYLPAGNTSYVKIINNANGYVIADAVRFKYWGETPPSDTIPPDAPSNVRIEHLDEN